MGVDKYTPELIARTEAMLGEREDELVRWGMDLERWNQELRRPDVPADKRAAAVVVEDAERRRGAAMARLQELKRQGAPGGDPWFEMREAVDMAWREAKEAFEKARQAITG